MKSPDIYLLCFAIGAIWSLATVLLGGLHLGHGHSGHLTHASGHGHAGHHGHGAHGHTHGSSALASWLGSLTNPNSIAVFLAWSGGIGYLLSRHTGFEFWTDLAIALGLGLFGAWLLAAFLRFLQSHEKPLDPSDYDLIGTLGRVSSPIRPIGVGEMIYVKDGTRKPLCARSEDGRLIAKGEEVVVTRFEKGVAYVRTWDAIAQPDSTSYVGELAHGDSPKREKEDVE